jgi:hypothetical protein
MAFDLQDDATFYALHWHPTNSMEWNWWEEFEMM